MHRCPEGHECFCLIGAEHKADCDGARCQACLEDQSQRPMDQEDDSMSLSLGSSAFNRGEGSL